MRIKREKPRGILAHQAAAQRFEHQRFHPSAALGAFIEHFWSVTWNVEEASSVETLPHPSVHLSFENDAALLVGVQTGRFSRTLSGQGSVFAVKFLPASFHAFFPHSLKTLTNRSIDPRAIFGPDFSSLSKAIHSTPSIEDKIQLAETFLLSLYPQNDDTIDSLNALLGLIVRDPTLTRVSQLPNQEGRSVRQLQRLFQDYIGVTPKWVIARYRIHEALEHIHSHATPDWSDLACRLGYSDQAHFIRDF